MKRPVSFSKPFTAHPASVGESYSGHFVTAMGFSLALFKAALVCAVHAVFPFLFEKAGSEAIRGLHDRMVANRCRVGADEQTAAPKVAIRQVLRRADDGARQ